jgi:NADH pyrophosphatase NudC (nudix superfamily)
LRAVLPKDFKNFLYYKAIVINHNSVLIKDNTPLIVFKNILENFSNQIDKVFFANNLMYVDIDCKKELQSHIFIEAKYCIVSHDKINKAYQWLSWYKRANFCQTCADKLHFLDNSLQKKCFVCDALFFPNLAPAVIVLIKKDKQMLLARGAHFPTGVFSLIAGFVDPGESAEDAVKREVYEEVGLKVNNIRYFASQSWPFGASFMMAFIADYVSGEIKIDTHEIEQAAWFGVDNLPPTPTSSSIACKLINHCINTN